MKKSVLYSLIGIAAILATPIAIFSACLLLPPQFSSTYYGELVPMHKKLKKTKGKKIVVIGNSNIAFGVDSSLIQNELQSSGYDYSVCNFGLYGSIGTKAMLDLAKRDIKKGDIVILAPEINSQSLSTYFSAKELYRAIETDLGMMFELDNGSKTSMIGSFSSFVAEKLKYSRKSSSVTGVYAKSSFDDNCDLKNYDRSYNTMFNQYDSNNIVTFDKNYLSNDFIDYLNDYFEDINKKGASMYYSFSPINQKAISSTKEEINEWCSYLDEKIDFEIMSNPFDYIMDEGYFYDTNFHLNSDGMTKRSVQLVSDIKNLFGDSSTTNIEVPGIPAIIADVDDESDGDNSDLDCFVYKESDSYAYITSLSDIGMGKESITIPYRYNGKIIRYFEPETFSELDGLKTITIQKNINQIKDNSFKNSSVKQLYLEHDDPNKIRVGYNLMDAPLTIYVRNQYLKNFVTDYTWGYYADSIKAY